MRHLIHVLDGPTITSQPQSLAINAGGSAGFSVAATGAGALTYQWFFNCINLPGATNLSYALNQRAIQRLGKLLRGGDGHEREQGQLQCGADRQLRALH